MPRARESDPRAGFTLLEVMIAAMILVAGMVSIMGLFAMALHTHRGNLDTAKASLIRADVLPEAQQRALDVTENGMVVYRDLPRAPVPAHPGYFYELQIESRTEGQGEVAILTISWRGGGKLQRTRSRHVFRAEKPFSELITTRFKEEKKP